MKANLKLNPPVFEIANLWLRIILWLLFFYFSFSFFLLLSERERDGSNGELSEPHSLQKVEGESRLGRTKSFGEKKR